VTDVKAISYNAPNPIDLAQQQTMQALKYIDPTSAAANGLPPPNLQGADVGSMLAAKNYAPPGVPAPAAAAAAPSPAAPPPPPPPPGPALGMGDNIIRGLAQGTGPNTPGYAMGMPGTMGLPGQDALLAGLAQGGTNPWLLAPSYQYGG